MSVEAPYDLTVRYYKADGTYYDVVHRVRDGDKFITSLDNMRSMNPTDKLGWTRFEVLK